MFFYTRVVPILKMTFFNFVGMKRKSSQMRLKLNTYVAHDFSSEHFILRLAYIIIIHKIRKLILKTKNDILFVIKSKCKLLIL